MNRREQPLYLRPEHEVLLACARAKLAEARVAQLHGLLTGWELDWELLLSLAQRHGLNGLVYTHLCGGREGRASIQSLGETIPPGVQRRLREAYGKQTQANLTLTAELLRLMRAFESQGVIALAYKGPALAVDAYGSIALRPFCDLDILVRPRDLDEARRILLAQNYTWRDEHLASLSPKEKAREEAMGCDQTFVHRDGQGVVELHWSFMGRDLPFGLDIEDVWQRRVSSPLAPTGTVATLSREDLLLALCAHGGKHGWYRLEWISSVAEVARGGVRGEGVNWPALLERARAAGAERMLLLGLRLARELSLLDDPASSEPPALPDPVIARLQADRVTASLSAQLQERLFTQRPKSRGRRRGHYLWSTLISGQMRERRADRLRLLWYRSQRYLRGNLRSRRRSGKQA